MRARISSAAQRYSGSEDVTGQPRRVASALKLAGPSAAPRIDRPASALESANMRPYSSKVRPHGTIVASVNIGPRIIMPGHGGVQRSGFNVQGSRSGSG